MLLRTAVMAAAVATLAACDRPPDRPDIVLIYTDDQSINSIEFMPKLKEIMIDKGVTFANSFVDFSLCCPSRASFFTGQSAHNTGVVGNGTKTFGGYKAFKPFEEEALPVRLQAAGYETAFFGKYINDYKHGVPPGWDRWVAYWGHAKHFSYRLNIDGEVTKFGDAPEDYGDDVIGRFAVEWIEQANERKPFFVMVSTENSPRTEYPAEAARGRVRRLAAAEAAQLQRGRYLGQAALQPAPAVERKGHRRDHDRVPEAPGAA